MRSLDYSKPWETYTPHTMPQMVRAALIDGVRRDRGHEPKDRLRYRRILEAYLDMKPERMGAMYRILQVVNPTKRQEEYLDDLLKEAAPKSKLWRQFSYEHLAHEGVIVKHNGDIQSLVSLLWDLPENQVVFTDAEIAKDGIDYLKHVKPSQMIILNSRPVIEIFAREKGFDLPESYKKHCRLNEGVYQLLEQHNFTFIEAFKSALQLLKGRYSNRNVSVFVIKRRNGDEVRLFPYDFLVKGTELFYEVRQERYGEVQKTASRQGKVEPGEFKYHGTNIFTVPRMFPTKSRKFDEVTVSYLAPIPDRPRDMTLEWFNTITSCNCDWSLNTRNFEQRRGRMARVVTTFDVHARFALLYVAEEGPKKEKQTFIMYPTPEFVRFVDKSRFNLCKDEKFIGHLGVNILIMESFKQQDNFDNIVTFAPPEISQILRPI